MNFREKIPLLLAAVVLGLAVVQAYHPISRRMPPVLLFFMAVLLGLRWVLRRQALKRRNTVEDVPKHPLGISGDREQ